MAHRVIQWSTGNVGKGVLKAVLERPGLELAGLYVFSDDKVGQDAGDIISADPTGVIATNDVQSLLDTNADVLIHTSLPSLVYGENLEADIETICTFLRSGIDVITTVGYLYPKSHGDDVYNKIAAACADGSSTYHSTGLNPGWMGDVLPLCMTGLSRRIDQIEVREITNFEFYPSPEIMFDMMGFGKTEAEFEQHTKRYNHWLNGLFVENVQMMADALEVQLDDIQSTTTRVVTAQELKVAAGVVEAGTVAGQRWEWAGIKDGNKVISHETVWRMHRTIAPDWPDGDHTINIKGKPNLSLSIGPRWIDDGLLATGMHAVNAIPYVCDAGPGIKTLIDLPMIVPKGLFS